MVQPLHIKNARIWNGNGAEVRDLCTTDVVQAAPAHDALVVDLEGYTIFPGLINAHDHLELNHYPRTKFREVYNNAHEWGEDVNARLNESPFKELRAYPLWDRLFIGGLKNLLCGATTVAHHNPPHKELFRKDFPVRVLRKYGWAHSLHFSTDAEIVASYRSTPKDVPWFIHLAEGTDEIAAGEYGRLEALGCVGKNTVIVHGVGLSIEDAVEAHGRVYWGSIGHGGVKIVWCPSTNYYLLGKTLGGRVPAIHSRLALGTDSRLTAKGDLLDELHQASKETFAYAAYIAVQGVTEEAIRVTGVNHQGHLLPDAYADFIGIRAEKEPPDASGAHTGAPLPVTDEIPNSYSFDSEHYREKLMRLNAIASILCNSRRADLALVVKGGVPQIGDPEVMAKFPHIRTVGATLDGRPKSIHIDLAKRIHLCQLKEAGLEVEALPKRRLFARGQ